MRRCSYRVPRIKSSSVKPWSRLFRSIILGEHCRRCVRCCRDCIVLQAATGSVRSWNIGSSAVMTKSGTSNASSSVQYKGVMRVRYEVGKVGAKMRTIRACASLVVVGDVSCKVTVKHSARDKKESGRQVAEKD